MISANQLPTSRSVYEAPPLVPGQELTAEQQQQNMTAQIAGIVVGVAAAKKAIEVATTNQIVALLHAADLLTEAGIKAFASAAALLVRIASRQAQELTWTGAKMRAEVVGIRFTAQMPSEEEMPAELRYGRSTGLEEAYARIATEYRDNLNRTREDDVIKELVAQFESELLTPLPRPDNISSDAVERIADGKADWTEAFQKAIEDQGGEIPEGPSDEEIAKDSLAERRKAAREERERELQKLASIANAARSKSTESKGDSGSTSAYAESSDQEVTIRLTDAEVSAVIERYAEQKAGERAERMVSQDIAGASRNMHNIAMSNMDSKQVEGYRRVVHPELSESGQSCGLCIVASTMVYKKSDLLPIHSGCNCETVEIYSIDGEIYDPGHLINMEDLDVFYREAGGSTHGWDLKKGRYKVVNHPEYGPTLINAHPNKRGNVKKEYIPIEG